MRTATFSRCYVNLAVFIRQLQEEGGKHIAVNTDADVVSVVFERICYDANGYHEGYESVRLSIPLVPARPVEVFPPAAWQGVVDSPAIYPADVIVDVGAAEIVSLDCPAESYYDAEEGQDEDERELRYSPLSEDEAWEILVPWCIRNPEEEDAWRFTWAFQPADGEVPARWALVPAPKGE